ncbi:MAG TPA: LytTR family DNA-binding domain-containing protein [Puia sp.]
MRTRESTIGKTSFLVFTQNRYVTVATASIALFYIRHTSSSILCFDRHEYFVDYSLDHLQDHLSEQQFFRVNRQYLVNFTAVKEVEHYFARKLQVKLAVPLTENLLVPREKASAFLRWLGNR